MLTEVCAYALSLLAAHPPGPSLPDGQGDDARSAPLLGERPAPRPAPLRIEGGIELPDGGLPLGNGVLGVLVWGSGDRLRLSFDPAELSDLRPGEEALRDAWDGLWELVECGDHESLSARFASPHLGRTPPSKIPGGCMELVLEEGWRIDGFRLELDRARVRIDVSNPHKASQSLDVVLHATEPIARVAGYNIDHVELVPPPEAQRSGYGPPVQSAGGWPIDGWTAFSQSDAGTRPTAEPFALAAAWKTAEPPHLGQPYLVAHAAALLRGEDAAERAVAVAASVTDGYRSTWPEDTVRRHDWNSAWIRVPHPGLQAQIDLAQHLDRASVVPGAAALPPRGLGWARAGLPDESLGADEDPSLAEPADGPSVLARMLDIALDRIDEAGTRDWVSSSLALNAAMNAVARRPERTLARLEQYLGSTGPNGLHRASPRPGAPVSGRFSLEGNFLCLDTVQRMLLDPRTDALEVFPAVPAAWSDVDFERLRAHGGLTVSASRREGATHAVCVRATVRTTFALVDPFPPGDEVNWNRAVERRGRVLAVTLDAGEVLRAER